MRDPLQSLRRNWPWKLAALAVALIVFFGVRRSVSYTQTLTLSVEAETVEGSQALMGISPGVVSVTFRGSEAAIRRLSVPGAEPPIVRLRLRQPPEGASSERIRLTRRDVLCDDGLRVVSIEPASVVATFDSRATRVFQVSEPIVVGAPAFGEVQVSIEPKTVEVTGSRALLEEFDEARSRLATATLDVANRSTGFQTVLRVLPPDSRAGWHIRPDSVRADVRIIREDGSRVFPEVPVRVLQSASGQRYAPDVPTVKVTAWGARRELATIDPAGVVALVGEGADGAALPPVVVLPCSNRVSRVEVEPPRVALLPEGAPDTRKEEKP